MKPELPAHWITILDDIFKQWCPEFEVWAYGSRVTGQHHDGSDLDLVLIHPKQPDTIPCKYWLDIKTAITESNIPIMVDILDWSRLPKTFQDEIAQHKVKLFDAINAN